MDSAEGVPLKVLLVEDNPGDVMIITGALEDAEISTEVEHVGDGLAALDFLYQRGEYSDVWRPDMVLLDINLPGMNGLDVLQNVKKDETLSDIPIIMLTSSDADVDLEKAHAANADAYMTKGFDFDELERTLQSTVAFWVTQVDRGE